MIITVKNLQQQTFTVDFEQEKTVRDLKQTIFNERGPEYMVEKQKLIYAGIILDDERTIASYNVDEKKFVVVMLKRDLGGAAANVQYTTTPTIQKSTGTTHEKNDSKTAQKVDEKYSVTSDKDTKSQASSVGGNITALSGFSSSNSAVPVAITDDNINISSGNNSSRETSHATHLSSDFDGSCSVGDVLSNTLLQTRAESNLLMGAEYNRTVASMIEMGYCRELVERAMAASFNNPERAVEYLISGIPETDDGFNATTAVTGESELLRGIVAADAGNGSSGELDVGINVARNRSSGVTTLSTVGSNVDNSGYVTEQTTGARDDPFEFLRNQPQFAQMRSLVFQNPDLLHAVLQQIGQTNPALLQLISENQDAFLSMLNQPTGDTENINYQRNMTSGRRAQLAAAARAATDSGGGGVSESAQLDTAPGSDGDSHRANTLTHDLLFPRSGTTDTNEQHRTDSTSVSNADDVATVAALTAAAAARDAGVGAGDDQRLQTSSSIINSERDGVATIDLTSHDHDAIERLKALGFPEALVLQAYFACEKDEQLAANFLISSAFDD